MICKRKLEQKRNLLYQYLIMKIGNFKLALFLNQITSLPTCSNQCLQAKALANNPTLFIRLWPSRSIRALVCHGTVFLSIGGLSKGRGKKAAQSKPNVVEATYFMELLSFQTAVEKRLHKANKMFATHFMELCSSQSLSNEKRLHKANKMFATYVMELCSSQSAAFQTAVGKRPHNLCSLPQGVKTYLWPFNPNLKVSQHHRTD